MSACLWATGGKLFVAVVAGLGVSAGFWLGRISRPQGRQQ